MALACCWCSKLLLWLLYISSGDRWLGEGCDHTAAEAWLLISSSRSVAAWLALSDTLNDTLRVQCDIWVVPTTGRRPERLFFSLTVPLRDLVKLVVVSLQVHCGCCHCSAGLLWLLLSLLSWTLLLLPIGLLPLHSFCPLNGRA